MRRDEPSSKTTFQLPGVIAFDDINAPGFPVSGAADATAAANAAAAVMDKKRHISSCPRNAPLYHIRYPL
jgi:hypothetical protein